MHQDPLNTAREDAERQRVIAEARWFINVRNGNTNNRAYPLVQRLLLALEKAHQRIEELS